MATQSVNKAAAKVVPRFKLGEKKIYLPNHVITFIRPKPNQPPTLATFVVPLTFNKFDLRDYLHNAYNVQVTGVRSFINERKPERKNQTGAWYRPRSQKMMIAELVRPFVWPDPPAKTAEARSEFDYQMFLDIEKERTRHTQQQKDAGKRKVPLRDQLDRPASEKLMRREARELAAQQGSGGAGWSGKALLDEGEGRWVEVEEEVKVPPALAKRAAEKAEGSARPSEELSTNREYDVVVEDQKEQHIPPKK